MDSLDQPSEPMTLVISAVVEPSQIQTHEAWSQGFSQTASQFEDFLGVNVICPRDHACPEYVVMVKFDSYAHFKHWQDIGASPKPSSSGLSRGMVWYCRL